MVTTTPALAVLAQHVALGILLHEYFNAFD
jgi:hypothetical protein